MAAAMLLAATIVPHHHHNSIVCPMVERCSIDGQPNDEHTAHKSDRQGSSNDDCTFSATTLKAGNNGQLAGTVVALPAQNHAITCPPRDFTTLLPMPWQWHTSGAAALQPQLRAPPLAIA